MRKLFIKYNVEVFFLHNLQLIHCTIGMFEKKDTNKRYKKKETKDYDKKSRTGKQLQ